MLQQIIFQFEDHEITVTPTPGGWEQSTNSDDTPELSDSFLGELFQLMYDEYADEFLLQEKENDIYSTDDDDTPLDTNEEIIEE